MAVAAVWYPHALDLDGSNVITELQDVTPANNFQDIVEYSAGEAAPQNGGSYGAVPDINFTTPQCKTILDLINVEAVAKDLSAGSVDMYFRKGDPNATREATAATVHDRWRLTTNAVLALQTIEASQNSLATVRARLLPVWNGSNNPIIATGSVALSGTSAASEFYTLGRVDINGTDISAVADVSIDYQVEFEEVADSGEPFISYGGIRRFAPRVSIRSRDVTLFRTYGAAGTALSSLEVYLRKMDASGHVVANATTQHIKFTATAGTIRAREVSGVPEAVVSVDIDLLKPNATTDPLLISSTAVAIT